MSSPPQVPRRRRGCLRLLLVLSAIGLLLALLHQPLLRYTLQRIGPVLAARAGIRLDWQVRGSLWRDFGLQKVVGSGTENHWLTRLEAGEVGAEYNLQALWRGDFTGLIERLHLRRLHLKADLRRLPPSRKKTPEASGPPPPVWPRQLDLEDLDLDVILADGSRLLVRGLSLRAGPGQPGTFHCSLLQREPGGLKLENLQAVLRWEPLRVELEKLALPSGLTLENASLDLRRLWQPASELRLKANGNRGKAGFRLEAVVAGLFAPPRHLEADLSVRGLDTTAFAGLGLPQDLNVADATAELHLRGDPAKPRELAGEVRLTTAAWQAAGLRADRLEAGMELAEGRLRLTEVLLVRGANQLRLEGTADLPARLQDWRQTRWQAEWRAELPEPAAWLDKAPPLQGRLDLAARAQGVGPVPTEWAGELRGAQLALDGRRLPDLDSRFRLDGRSARLEIPDLRLGADNRAAFSAVLGLEKNLPLELSLQADFPDPAAWMASFGLTFPASRAQAVLHAEGRASMALADVLNGNLDPLQADLKVQVTDIAWDGQTLGPLQLQLQARDGKLQLQNLRLEADGRNSLALTGAMDLHPPHAFTAEGSADLTELAVFNALTQSFGVPELLAGNAKASLSATGQIRPWTCQGAAELHLANLRLAGQPEALRLDLQTAFTGQQVRVLGLEAGAGPWRLNALGALDARQAGLDELQFWQDERLLLEGHLRMPLGDAAAGSPPLDVELHARDLPIHEVLAAAGQNGLPAGRLHLELRLQGTPKAPIGSLQVRWLDLIVPQLPPSFQAASLGVDSHWQDGRLESLLDLTLPPLQPLTLKASLPLDPDTLRLAPDALARVPLEASLTLPESDLGFLRDLAPKLIQALPARVRLEASLTGSAAEPHVQASLDLDAAEILWQSPDLPSVRDLRLRLRGQDRQLDLEDASLLLAGGRVRLTGGLDASDLKTPQLSLRLRADEALVYRDAGASLRANADLAAEATPDRGRLSGDIELVRGRVFREIDLLPLLKLPADVPAVPPDTRRREARLELPAFLHPWEFDVRVRTRDPVHLSGNLANGTVSADVHLTGTGASPQLNGGARIERLQLQLPFSVVRMTQGAITLRPERPLDPDLDLRGESRIGNHDISLFIYGPSTGPKTRFTSSPPLSEPDIATLLATGTTLNGSAAELASEAASRAAYLFASELTRKLFRRKKVVREDPPRLQLSFTPSGADRSQGSIQAAYDLTRHWRLTNRFTQNGRMKTAIGYLLRFGERVQALGEPVSPPP